MKQKPWLLISLVTLITLALLLPFFYLIIRAVSVGERAIPLLMTWRTLSIILNSAGLAITVTFFSLLIALPLAWLTVRTELPGRRIWIILTTLPLVFPSYVGGYAFVAMVGPKGMLQQLLEPLGVERLPSIYGWPGAVLVLTLFTYPYLLLNIRTGLRHLDPALEEAARGLGYNSWETFWYMTLPALRPSIASGSLLVSLYVLSDFGAVSILQFNSFTRAIYIQYQNSFDRSLASLLSILLVGMTILLLVGARHLQGTWNERSSGNVGVARKQRRSLLRGWTWPVLLFCSSIVLLGLIIPTSVIFYWLIRGLSTGESFISLWSASWHSVQAALLAALAATFFALPIAYLSVRYPSLYSTLTNRAVYLGYGLPGIVVALSLVFFGARYVPMLYQTLFMLVFAYIVRFLPQSLGTIRSSLLQVDKKLEEAAKGLGLNRQEILQKVIIPLLRPGIFAGAALVFLTTIKELPATLLLAPTGFSTLAIQVWSATDEAFFARAAAPALLLLAVSSLSIFIILKEEERGNL